LRWNDSPERAVSFQLAQGGLQRYKVPIQNVQLAENILHYLQLVSLQAAGSMKPIASNDGNQTLRPHPEEAALFARPSRRMAAGMISPVAVLRDARKGALLRTRLMDDIDMIFTMETLS